MNGFEAGGYLAGAYLAEVTSGVADMARQVMTGWPLPIAWSARLDEVRVLDDEALVRLGQWGGYWIDIRMMGFNERLVLTPQMHPTGLWPGDNSYDHGWCYPRGGIGAITAALLWNPDTDAEPPGYVKRATARPRVAGETAQGWQRPRPQPQWPDPEAADTCRQMITRRCPRSYGDTGCGPRLCARYESDDEGPWLAEIGHTPAVGAGKFGAMTSEARPLPDDVPFEFTSPAEPPVPAPPADPPAVGPPTAEAPDYGPDHTRDEVGEQAGFGARETADGAVEIFEKPSKQTGQDGPPATSG